MKLTYFGHSCFLVEGGGQKVLFDPFIRPNPLAGSVKVSQIEADWVLLSHGHVDHVADVVELANQTGAPVIANWEICEWLGRQGLKNLVAMNHGGTKRLGFGSVKMTNAIHSSTLPDGSAGGNPGGYVVGMPEGAFYYSGDTALTMDMKLIPEEFSIRFAVLPIGDNFTMGAGDAVRAARFVDTNIVVGVHYGTFPPIEIDPGEALGIFEKAGLTLLLPAIGETIEL
ncbi:MAG: metal-dependent hydrolase [Chthoniobacterales bacterium]|nr:metal-dependent hydrolase [Chthoniobacterales bacterium]